MEEQTNQLMAIAEDHDDDDDDDSVTEVNEVSQLGTHRARCECVYYRRRKMTLPP